jgi:hypothetical protein
MPLHLPPNNNKTRWPLPRHPCLCSSLPSARLRRRNCIVATTFSGRYNYCPHSVARKSWACLKRPTPPRKIPWRLRMKPQKKVMILNPAYGTWLARDQTLVSYIAWSINQDIMAQLLDLIMLSRFGLPWRTYSRRSCAKVNMFAWSSF